MSPAAALHARLASIMEVLANTAVAEICELVDNGYSVLQLEISRSRKENEVLRRKLRLMELRAARATALRAAVGGGRAHAQPPGDGGTGTPRAEAAPSRPANQERPRCRAAGPSAGRGGARDAPPAGESTAATVAVIKVEDGDESWSRPQQDQESRRAADGRTTETEAPPPQVKQEVTDEGGGSSHGSWLSGEVSSTSTQEAPSASRRADGGGGYDYLAYEPQLHHASTQNPLSEDPGCSYMLNAGASASADGGTSSFPFPESAAEQPAGFQGNQQLPTRRHAAPRQSAFIRRDRWGHQGGPAAIGRHADGGARAFVCNCCGKTLACLKNLKTHMRVHTGEKPFVCALCGKRFSDSSNLKRHQSVHTGEKRYGCVHCGKRFAQSGSLKVHMTVHTDCKQFRCSYCGKTFISGSHLRRHAAVHAGEKRFAPGLQ